MSNINIFKQAQAEGWVLDVRTQDGRWHYLGTFGTRKAATDRARLGGWC